MQLRHLSSAGSSQRPSSRAALLPRVGIRVALRDAARAQPLVAERLDPRDAVHAHVVVIVVIVVTTGVLVEVLLDLGRGHHRLVRSAPLRGSALRFLALRLVPRVLLLLEATRERLVVLRGGRRRGFVDGGAGRAAVGGGEVGS